MPHPITAAQQKALIGLISRIGKPRYWDHKDALGIPRAVTLSRLTKAQAWKLINTIATDLDSQRNRHPAGREVTR